MEDFQITYNEDTGIIETRIHGAFNSSLVDTMGPVIAKMVLEKNAKALLLDFSKSKISLSTMEMQKTGQDAHLNGPWRTVKRSMSHSNSE